MQAPDHPFFVAVAAGDWDELERVAKGMSGADWEMVDADDKTPMHLAVDTDDVALVDRLLAAGANPHVTSSWGTILTYAAYRGVLPLMQRLLAAGCDVNDPGNGEGAAPPIVTAASAAPLAAVRMLIEAGADVTFAGEGGFQAVHLAAARGVAAASATYVLPEAEQQALLECLLAAGASPTAVTDDGRTPLTFAAEADALGAVRVLLRAPGVDVNAADSGGRRALHAAAQYCTSAAAADLLLAHGADVHAANDEGWTALHLAASRSAEQHPSADAPAVAAAIIDRLAQAGARIDAASADGTTPLMLALEIGGPVPALRLLALGADATRATETTGMTPLLSLATAARSGAAWDVASARAMIRTLVQRGADGKGVRGDDGCGLTHISAGADNVAVLEAVLAEGLGSVDDAAPGGFTPLYCAAKSGSEACASLLLQRKADVNAATSDNNMTPLAAAAGGGHAAVVALLLRARADPNVAALPHGRCALHFAASARSVETIEALLRHGARVDAVDEHGISALFCAVGEGSVPAVRALCAAGADVNRLNAAGASCLTLIARANDVTPAAVDEMCDALVELGADIDAFRRDAGPGESMPALFYYLRASPDAVPPEIALAAVRALVRHGADVHRELADGCTALFAAATTAHGADRIRVLVEAGADPRAVTAAKTTLVHAAAANGCLGALELALAAGVSARATDCKGWTALHFAARLHIDDEALVLPMLRALLVAGTDATACDTLGKVNLGGALVAFGAPAALIADAFALCAELLPAASVRLVATNAVLMLAARERETSAAEYAAIVAAARAHGADLNAARNAPEDMRTALHFAVELGAADLVDALVAAGADVEARDSSGCTPLGIAVRLKDPGPSTTVIVRRLIAAGADCNSRDDDGVPCLFPVVVTCNLTAFEALAAAGADLRADLPDSRTTLVHAVAQVSSRALQRRGGGAGEAGLAKMLQVLLDAGADIDARNQDGRSAIFMAVAGRNNSALRVLLRAGASTAVIDDDGYSAGHYAINNGDVDALQTLLDSGMDPNLVTGEGRGLLSLAVEHDNPLVMGALLAAPGVDINHHGPEDHTALHFAVARRNIGAIKALLAAGAEVDARSDSDLTPLLYAIKLVESEDIVALLLAAGADVNAVGGVDGDIAPIGAAAEIGHAGIFRRLAAAGVREDARMREGGWNALHCCAFYGRADFARELITKYRFDPNPLGDDGCTPLHMHVLVRERTEARLAAAEELIALGMRLDIRGTPAKITALHAVADWDAGLGEVRRVVAAAVKAGGRKAAALDARDRDGWSALTYAALNQNGESLHALLALGADPNIMALNGITALRFALKKGREDYVTALLAAGALFDTVNGTTPLHDAAESSSAKLLRLVADAYRAAAAAGTAFAPAIAIAEPVDEAEAAEEKAVFAVESVLEDMPMLRGAFGLPVEVTADEVEADE